MAAQGEIRRSTTSAEWANSGPVGRRRERDQGYDFGGWNWEKTMLPFFRFSRPPKTNILLMEEIPKNHLECIKPYE